MKPSKSAIQKGIRLTTGYYRLAFPFHVHYVLDCPYQHTTSNTHEYYYGIIIKCQYLDRFIFIKEGRKRDKRWHNL